MDDRTYRRMFQETYQQARRRHNGLVRPILHQRKCRRCQGTGRRLDEPDSKADAPCNSCGGTGLKTYRRG